MIKRPTSTSKSNPFHLEVEHLHFRRTKIVATVGPASSSPAMLRKLIKAGVNVVRVNFSHGEPAAHVELMGRIRVAAAAAGTSVAILADLCGPKIRVGKFNGGQITLREKSTVTITTKPVTGTAELIESQYRALAREVSPGEQILLDDGNLELRVLRVDGSTVRATVVRGGVLKDHKGMNLPDTKLGAAALTAKDKSDVRFAVRGGADYIALSFVRRASDIASLRRLLDTLGADTPIIAKIEMPEALDNIQAIIDAADGIMVARGDLGVEMPPQKVPLIQNKLIQLANRRNKPVIVATQMLESMIDHGRPTRAEVTDVAGACLAGTDAVMLSAETAAGKYPLATVQMMDAILRETEAHQFFTLGGRFPKAGHDRSVQVQNALGNAAAQLSRDLKVRCVFVATRSGYTARFVSSDRPAAPIIALTRSPEVARRLNLLWGVSPEIVKAEFSTNEYIRYGEAVMRRLKLARKGDYLVMLSGLGKKQLATNSIIVHQVR